MTLLEFETLLARHGLQHHVDFCKRRPKIRPGNAVIKTCWQPPYVVIDDAMPAWAWRKVQSLLSEVAVGEWSIY